MRLIDADDVFARIPNNLPYKSSVRRVLIQAEEVDAVPVVRCKDCRHMTIEQGLRYCNVWERFNGAGDDGFCNYGELKDGAE